MSKEENKRKINKIKKIKKICGEDMWHVGKRVGRWGGSFPTWTIQLDKNQMSKKKKKEKMTEKEKRNGKFKNKERK